MGAATESGGRAMIGRAVSPRLAADPRESRYRPPSLRDGLVWRKDLLARLARTQRYPLLLVTAPAGYGKTTLLAQSSARAEDAVVWVGLDQDQPDRAVLAEAIASALEWNEINPVRPTVSFRLVIDDAHRVAPDVLREVVLDVLGWQPPGSQLVLASRCRPALPLGRMRGHRTLVELGARALAMSAVEAAALIRE